MRPDAFLVVGLTPFEVVGGGGDRTVGANDQLPTGWRDFNVSRRTRDTNT